MRDKVIKCISQTHFPKWYVEHFLLNWIQNPVDIKSTLFEGLMPSGNKLLPKPMVSQMCVARGRNWATKKLRVLQTPTVSVHMFNLVGRVYCYINSSRQSDEHMRQEARPYVGSNNNLSSDMYQPIIWNNAWLISIIPLGTNFVEIAINVQQVS